MLKNQRSLEIKSAVTFSQHFLKNIQKVKEMTKDRCQDGYVFYDGDEKYNLNNVRIQNILKHGLLE